VYVAPMGHKKMDTEFWLAGRSVFKVAKILWKFRVTNTVLVTRQ
jgi:hypothetical protein